MCSESSSKLYYSSGQTGGRSDGGVSSRTPRSDGTDGPSMRSTSGHGDSGTHENSLLGFSSHRKHSPIKDSSSVLQRSRPPSGRKGSFLRALKIIKRASSVPSRSPPLDCRRSSSSLASALGEGDATELRQDEH